MEDEEEATKKQPPHEYFIK